MEDNLMCSCGWIGHRMELVCTDEKPDEFIHCPDCFSAEELEEESEED